MPKEIRPSTANILSSTQTEEGIVFITPSKKVATPDEARLRRMKRTSYQAKLGKKIDNITNKVLDNNIRLASHPTDMLRIEVERDERSHDIVSRTITNSEIMPVILPKMEDIPMRQFKREGTETMIPSLFSIAQEEYFEVYAPTECNLNEDDLLIRILYDKSPNIDEPYIFVLQVKEVLGTFGYSSLLWKKCLTTFYDEALPPAILTTIQEAIEKRDLLNW